MLYQEVAKDGYTCWHNRPPAREEIRRWMDSDIVSGSMASLGNDAGFYEFQ